MCHGRYSAFEENRSHAPVLVFTSHPVTALKHQYVHTIFSKASGSGCTADSAANHNDVGLYVHLKLRPSIVRILLAFTVAFERTESICRRVFSLNFATANKATHTDALGCLNPTKQEAKKPGAP